jgi:hypothetical protein
MIFMAQEYLQCARLRSFEHRYSAVMKRFARAHAALQ